MTPVGKKPLPDRYGRPRAARAAARLNAPDAYIVGTRMGRCEEQEAIAAALDANGYGMYTDRAGAIRVVEADCALPRCKRLGMRRTAWIFSVTDRALLNRRAPCRVGGLDALKDFVRRGVSQRPRAGAPLVQ